MMREHGASIADKRSTVGSDVVLVGSELTAFGGDTLQFLLGWSVRVSDVHEKALLANRLTMKLLNDIIADVTVLKAVTLLASSKLLIFC
jgi:hypothetical protein